MSMMSFFYAYLNLIVPLNVIAEYVIVTLQPFSYTEGTLISYEF